MTTNRLTGRYRFARFHDPAGRVTHDRVLTNIAPPGRDREGTPGSGMVATATVLLGALAIGLFAVSLTAQYRYVLDVKHEALSAWIEAAALDVGMTIFSLLALGLARAGQPARVERVLICACAAGSAVMNYAAVTGGSARSVLAYVMPPIFLAVVVDRVVAVVRRHVLGLSERSAWTFAGRTALYGLRVILAPWPTALGLRRWVLAAAPLPGQELSAASVPPAIAAAPDRKPRAVSGGRTKKAVLLDLYAKHRHYGDRSKVSQVATELADAAGLQSGTARSYLYAAIDKGSAA